MMCDMLIMICVLVVSVTAGFGTAVCIHETGHLLGGVLTNYKFVTIAVFGISIHKGCGKYMLKVRKDLGVGVCFMRPLSQNQNPYALIAGGVTANMLLAVATLVMGVFSESLYTMAVFVCVGGMNLIMGIYNIVPHSPSNDGSSLKEVRRGPEYVQMYNRIMMIYYEEENGTAPWKMDASLFSVPKGTDGVLADELRAYGEMVK